MSARRRPPRTRATSTDDVGPPPPLADHEARRAIATELDVNLVVEAAAGTGKTTEMVSRMVALIARGRTTVDRIVAMTFTEKAAGEMKLRVRARLERERQASAPASAERARLEAAIAHLEEAWVGTIHGFCAEILRERSVDAGVDPGFEVLDEREAHRLFSRSFQRWFEETLFAPGEGVRRLLRRRPRDDDDDPVRRLERAADGLREWRDLDAPWRRPRFDRIAQVDGLVEQVMAFADLTARAARPRDDGLWFDTEPGRELADEIRRAERVRPRDHDGLEADLIGLLRRRMGRNSFDSPRSGRSAEYAPGLARAAVQAAHASLIVALKTFAEAADADLAACLQGELRGVLEHYQAAKQRLGRLDYLDLVLKARDLVRDRSDVRSEFQQRFTHYFVDEFQDTDLLQAELLMLLASQDPAERSWRRVVPAPGRLFVVGDPKQAIYRFRRADLAVYQEVRDLLVRRGARSLTLTASFRSLPAIQAAVNHAFAAPMDGDRAALQAPYLPLHPVRPPRTDQPAVVALPVPSPMGAYGVSGRAIEASLPAAIAAFVDWVIEHSGWTVTENSEAPPVPVAARHVCLLFRRFTNYGRDVTRPYLDELERRQIQHLLVGGRSFHERAEIEALRTALTGIEWPDDELSVFATLRGPFLSIGDEELLEYRHRHGRLHPFRRPEVPADDRLAPIVTALELLAELHRERNRRPVAETLTRLLDATRAPAGFALQHAGEQVLANVLHVAEQARAFERGGGISFRGFVDQLRHDAEVAETGEAPILEAGSDGVRVMTLHKAKGLEFPIVILADPTAGLYSGSADRRLEPERQRCALRIAGLTPWELIEAREAEVLRDRAEGVRIAYVAATRARDVLVVPAVGDEIAGSGDGRLDGRNRPWWTAPLHAALYPDPARWRDSDEAPGTPRFGEDATLRQPGDHRSAGVRPGRHQMPGYDVVWWDANVLELATPARQELRHVEVLDPGAARETSADLERYRAWQAQRARTVERAGIPAVRVLTATAWATSGTADDPTVEIQSLARRRGGPSGPRFGSLVHAVMATIAFDAEAEQIRDRCEFQARLHGADADETKAAAELVGVALTHPLLRMARTAWQAGRCYREVPVAFRADDGVVIEGQADLAFEADDGWVVVDFKTGLEIDADPLRHRRQVGVYARAVAAATRKPARGVLLAL